VGLDTHVGGLTRFFARVSLQRVRVESNSDDLCPWKVMMSMMVVHMRQKLHIVRPCMTLCQTVY
jgi:hypothetical protein